jgi:D-arabinose 1-dehydrogenase-like Zn-dependent alcohol dehydrogenase
VNGGYAEYVLADPDYVGHLPQQVAFDQIAPILCAGVTVFKRPVQKARSVRLKMFQQTSAQASFKKAS